MQPEKNQQRQKNKRHSDGNKRHHGNQEKVHPDKINDILFADKNPSIETINYLQDRLFRMPVAVCFKIIKNSLYGKKQLEKTSKIAHVVVMKCLDYQLELNFLQAYLENLSGNKQHCFDQSQLHKFISLVKEIPQRILPYYYEAFKLQIPNQNHLRKIVERLMDKNFHTSALKFAELSKNKQILDAVITHPGIPRKQAVKAVTKLGYGRKQYPNLEDQMLQSSLFYFLREQGYQYVEQIFMVFPRTLLIGLLKGLQNNNKIAFSICHRNPETMNYMTKRQYQIFSDKINKAPQVIPNSLQNNRFGPSDPEKCIKFLDFGIKQEDIIIIKENSPHLQQHLKAITSSKIIGIDTESRVARTNFDKQIDLIQIIQIGTKDKVYIFDAKTCQNNQYIKQAFRDYILNPQHKIIGHTTSQDFSTSLAIFFGSHNMNGKTKCQVIDIKDRFKQVHPNQRCGLAGMCQTILKKDLCKKYTLTNWCRRPLLKNQIHYAAMDAYIVLILYSKLYEGS